MELLKKIDQNFRSKVFCVKLTAGTDVPLCHDLTSVPCDSISILFKVREATMHIFLWFNGDQQYGTNGGGDEEVLGLMTEADPDTYWTLMMRSSLSHGERRCSYMRQ